MKRAFIGEHLESVLDGLGVADADVELNFVDIVGIAVDLLPSLVAGGVEVVLDDLLVAAADLLGLELPAPLGIGEGEEGGEGGDGAATDDCECSAVDGEAGVGDY